MQSISRELQKEMAETNKRDHQGGVRSCKLYFCQRKIASKTAPDNLKRNFLFQTEQFTSAMLQLRAQRDYSFILRWNVTHSNLFDYVFRLKRLYFQQLM